MKSRILTAAAAAALVGPGCAASLHGIPQGLGVTDRTDLRQVSSITKQIAVADNLIETYTRARNENLKYAFWSNAALIPLAAGAASAVAFHANRQTIAGIGVGAGALIGANSLFNARPNAKAYQAGITALTCEITNLAPYDTLPVPDDALVKSDLTETAALLDTKTISDFKVAGGEAVMKYATAVSDLKSAITDAKKALDDAATATVLKDQAGVFLANATRSIDGAVAAKISQSDVDFAKLSASISALATPAAKSASASGDKPQPAPAAQPPGPLAAAAPDTDTVAERTQKIGAQIATLKDHTAALTAKIASYGLATVEATVTACVKALT